METSVKKTKLFNSYILKKTEKLWFHFLNISSYTEDIKKLFDNSIAQILNGIEGDPDIELAKIEFKNWLISKENDQLKRCGFVAEFLCHVYLSQLEFQQHFLFRNLEETKSMKKGFDGLYQLKEEIWIYESKSSLHTTKDANHNSNISEAYNDIKNKLSGKKLDSQGQPIDPWTNAISHASQIQIKPDKTLINNLNIFKKKFLKKEYEKILNFNIIPSSTIFLEDKWEIINSEELESKIEALCKRYEYKKMNVLCINKKSIEDFMEYLNG